MIVYHGTADCVAPLILTKGPCFRPRLYLPHNRKAFCATTEFKIAALFAFRNTLAEHAIKGIVTGVVLEFRLTGKIGVDFQHVCDRNILQDEKEIAIFQGASLKPLAIWANRNGKWYRKKLS